MLEIFKEPFMRTALIAGLLGAGLCSYLGVFVVLKRIVFIGMALSEIAVLGVALGLFIGLDPIVLALVLTICASVLFWAGGNEKNISRESIIGLVYVSSMAASIMLIAKNPRAESRGLDFISGNLLYAGWPEIKILVIAALFILLLHLFFFKEFIFVSFDYETAKTSGLRANLFNFLLFLSLGIAISLSMKICGVVFVFASLLIPAMIGLEAAKSIGSIFFISCLSAGLCVVIGLLLSYMGDLPSGPTIVGMYSLVFILITLGKKLLGFY